MSEPSYSCWKSMLILMTEELWRGQLAGTAVFLRTGLGLWDKARLGPVLPTTPAPIRPRSFVFDNYKQGREGFWCRSNHYPQRNAREGFVVLTALFQYLEDRNHAHGCERGLTSRGPTANSWQSFCAHRWDESWLSSKPDRIREVFYRDTVPALA